jgi:hypothetical protein
MILIERRSSLSNAGRTPFLFPLEKKFEHIIRIDAEHVMRKRLTFDPLHLQTPVVHLTSSSRMSLALALALSLSLF